MIVLKPCTCFARILDWPDDRTFQGSSEGLERTDRSAYTRAGARSSPNRAQVGRYSNRVEVAFMLSVEFGLRAGELVLMKTSDLIDVGGQLRREIVLNCASKPQSFELSSMQLRKTLANYCEANLSPDVPDGPVFRSQRTGALTRASLARLLTSLYQQAGILGGSSRSGRKTILYAGTLIVIADSGSSPRYQ